MSTSRRLENKLLVVGWDGADWRVARPLLAAGLMPNLGRLIERGAHGNIATLQPPFSPMLWTSIATGKRAHKHGIYGFTEPAPDGTGVQPITILSRRTKALWNILNQNGLKSVVVGWWPSHPAEPIDGVMVSNHFQQANAALGKPWPMLPGTVHPAERSEVLGELRMHPAELNGEHLLPFMPRGSEIDQDRDGRVLGCAKILAECTTIHNCAVELLERDEWDAAFVYHDALDHFSHGFMRYHPPRQEHIGEREFELYSNVISAGYVYHDMMLGRMLEFAGPDPNVIILSDHGFHPDQQRLREPPLEPAGPALEHRDVGMLVIAGPEVEHGVEIQQASLLDVTPTALHLLGLAVGEDMDGRPLTDVLAGSRAVERIASWDDVDGPSGQHPADRSLSSFESEQVLDQLVELGYIERPSRDAGKAVAECRRELDYNLAVSYIDIDRTAEAAEILVRLSRDHPLELRFLVKLALCLQSLGRTEELASAVAFLEQRWKKAMTPARERYEEVLAEVLTRREAEDKEIEEALSRDELQIDPELRGKLRKNERVILGRLIRLLAGPGFVVDFLKASVALSKGDLETAIDLLHDAEKTPTARHQLQLQLGSTYLELERPGDAEQRYRAILEADPEDPLAHLGMARVHMAYEQHVKALKSAQNAIALRYHLPAGHYYLALAEHRVGKTEEAIASLEQAITQNPNFPEAHDRLADIHERLEHTDVAAAHRVAASGLRAARESLEAERAAQPPLFDPSTYPEPDYDACLPALPTPPVSEERRAWLGLRPGVGDAPVDLAPDDNEGRVIVVSGLPRSGTSMMMKMLSAGGGTLLTDEVRAADESNPRGYFEFEQVKQLTSRNDWVEEARGKIVKVVTPLLPMLPAHLRYRIVLMRRDLREIIASQQKMLERLGRLGTSLGDDKLVMAFRRQSSRAIRSLKRHEVDLLIVDYTEAIRAPEEVAAQVSAFLQMPLDTLAMARVVEPELYRERHKAEESDEKQGK